MNEKDLERFKDNIEQMNSYIDNTRERDIIDPIELKDIFFRNSWLYLEDIIELLDKRAKEKQDLRPMMQFVCPICVWRGPLLPKNHNFPTKWDKIIECPECMHTSDMIEHSQTYYMKLIN